MKYFRGSCRQHKHRIQSSRWATKEPVLVFKLSSLSTSPSTPPTPINRPWEVQRASLLPLAPPEQRWTKLLVHLTLKTGPRAAAAQPSEALPLISFYSENSYFTPFSFELYFPCSLILVAVTNNQIGGRVGGR